MRTYARSACASELDFDRGFEALPGSAPAGGALLRLLLLLALIDQLRSINDYLLIRDIITPGPL